MPTNTASRAITVRRGGPADAGLLAALAAISFVETFAPDNRPDDMVAYVAGAFREDIQRGELADPGVTVLLAQRGDETIGYAMLRERPAPDCVGATNAIELVRLYARSEWIGAGVGSTLMRACLEEADARGCGSVWLGVWERNERAISFYRRWGFAKVGAQPFQLGRDAQTDHVMVRRADPDGAA